MKIVFQTTPKGPTFQNLLQGDLFMNINDRSIIYMKGSQSGLAMCLNTGLIVTFGPSTPVIPITATLTVD